MNVKIAASSAFTMELVDPVLVVPPVAPVLGGVVVCVLPPEALVPLGAVAAPPEVVPVLRVVDAPPVLPLVPVVPLLPPLSMEPR